VCHCLHFLNVLFPILRLNFAWCLSECSLHCVWNMLTVRMSREMNIKFIFLYIRIRNGSAEITRFNNGHVYTERGQFTTENGKIVKIIRKCFCRMVSQ
jgi:hypothetical protein